MQVDAIAKARLVLASLPLFAQGLAGATGVTVQIDRTARTASTDFKNIRIPALPLPTSEQDVDGALRLATLVKGFIPHEVGHIRHSKKSCYEVRNPKEKALVRLMNAIEDPRQEVELIKEFSGTREQLDQMTTTLIGPTGFYDVLTESDSPAWLVGAYSMYVLRGLLRGQVEFEELAEKSRPALEAVFGKPFTSRLNVLLNTSGPKMRSNQDALDLARRIDKAMQEEQQAQQERKKSQEAAKSDEDDGNEGEDSDASSAGDDTGDDATSGSKGGDSDDGEDGDDETQAADDDSGSGDDGSNQDKSSGSGDGAEDDASDTSDASSSGADGAGGSDQASTPDPQSIIDALQRAVDEAEEHGLKDLGDLVAGEIADQIDEIQKHGTDGYVYDESNAQAPGMVDTAYRRSNCQGSYDPTQALQQSGRIRAQLQTQLQALQRQRVHESVRGSRLNDRKVFRTSSGDRRLFLQQDDRRELNTAVFMLADISGSMQGMRIKLASDALYATAVALNGLRGVKTAVGTFPDYGMALGFGQRAVSQQDSFALKETGGTPLAQGVLWASRHLMARKEDRKILLVLTDGQPDCMGSAKAQILAAEAAGIETLGLGIELPMVGHMFKTSAVIRDLGELAPAMLSMLKGTLSSQLMAA
ncbi:MAG: hypothetical protein A2580_09150 [Hydrogenophilales bacterium RIFOXYD1_FULL_62_11]|nr:MAG: hypothetical protein A2580_09150 [Hydrogenophilales bacterium RIFOXYD1_FULL_62_11]